MSEAEATGVGGSAPPLETPTRVSRVGWIVTQGKKEIGHAASKVEAEAIGRAWAQTEADRIKGTAVLEIEDNDGDVERTRKFKPQE